MDPPAPHGFPGVVPAFLAKESTRAAAALRDQRWLKRSRPLGKAAPAWARRMYRRSLLVLRAFVDPRSGAAVAGAPAGWAYVWPRDAGAVAIALSSAGYTGEARRIARFLLSLELDAAARFNPVEGPVDGRAAQGDASGWVVAAATASGLQAHSPDQEGLGTPGSRQTAWRDHADYQEKDSGDYVGNAIASGLDSRRLLRVFGQPRGLVRSAGDPDSGLDAAAGWAVRPFPRPALFPIVRRTLLGLAASRATHFGLLPSEDWNGGEDPWTAPTAWVAWSLAALGERRAALGLIADLRRAATPLGLLPERVDADTGLPTSTTPLAWSHAFAILALRELWPVNTAGSNQKPNRR